MYGGGKTYRHHHQINFTQQCLTRRLGETEVDIFSVDEDL